MKTIKSILLTSIICITLTNCKDDIKLEGHLLVTFENITSDLQVVIYSAYNEQIPIYEGLLNKNGTFEHDLNIGNYILIPYSNSIFYKKIGFQIQQDKTIHIKYNTSNIGEIEF